MFGDHDTIDILPNENCAFTIAAVERVPEVKPEDVEEVIFGNVLSAGYDGPCPSPFRLSELNENSCH